MVSSVVRADGRSRNRRERAPRVVGGARLVAQRELGGGARRPRVRRIRLQRERAVGGLQRRRAAIEAQRHLRGPQRDVEADRVDAGRAGRARREPPAPPPHRARDRCRPPAPPWPGRASTTTRARRTTTSARDDHQGDARPPRTTAPAAAAPPVRAAAAARPPAHPRAASASSTPSDDAEQQRRRGHGQRETRSGRNRSRPRRCPRRRRGRVHVR